ncbi:MAG: septation regulator SpoVG [Acidobacteriota bacterium]
MKITEVRVFPVDEDKLKAFVSIVIDDVFVVSDIKVIQGRNGRFLSMPSTRRRNGTFRDIAHPLDQETRARIEEQVFARYDEVAATERRALDREQAARAQAPATAAALRPDAAVAMDRMA